MFTVDFHVGQIVASLNPTAPDGWLGCDGRSVQKADYPELYALLGDTYGAAGDEFSLPNLANRVLRGAAAGAPGDFGGGDDVTLTPDHLPAHAHPFRASSADAENDVPGGNVIARAGEDNFGQALDMVDMAPESIGPAGAETPQPVPLVPRHITVAYFIRATP